MNLSFKCGPQTYKVWLRDLNYTVTLTRLDGTKVRAEAHVFERGDITYWFRTNNRWITPYEFKKRYTGDIPELLSMLFIASYGDKIADLLPQSNMLLRGIKSDKNWAESMYHQPVVLGIEHGVTFNDIADYPGPTD